MAAEIVSAIFSGGQVALHTLSLASPRTSRLDRLNTVENTVTDLQKMLGDYTEYLDDKQYTAAHEKLDKLLNSLASAQTSDEKMNLLEQAWNYLTLEETVLKIEKFCKEVKQDIIRTSTDAKRQKMQRRNGCNHAMTVDDPKEMADPQTPTTREDSSEAISNVQAPPSSGSQDPLGVVDAPATAQTRSKKKDAPRARRPTETIELEVLSDPKAPSLPIDEATTATVRK